MERPELIRNFIDGGLRDNHLPLAKKNSKCSTRAFVLGPKSDAKHRGLESSEEVTLSVMGLFEQWQWKMLAPVFHRGENLKNKEDFIPDEAILPFTHQEAVCTGSHAEILKVKIHPEHHNFHRLEKVRYPSQATAVEY